jgi:hypothetical protein
VYGNFVVSTQFFFESKTAVKDKVYHFEIYILIYKNIYVTVMYLHTHTHIHTHTHTQNSGQKNIEQYISKAEGTSTHLNC